MPNGNPRSPKLLKGALIEFSNRFIAQIPNVIIFQYNPETMTRKLEPWSAGESEDGQAKGGKEPINAQPHDPPETFDLTLELDAADELEDPLIHPLAVVSGVANRIAALELLLYPEGDPVISGLISSISDGLSGGTPSTGANASQAVPRGAVPNVIFCWGPGRIVPVRLTSFSVEEQAFSPLLYPLRAKLSIGLKVIQPRNIPCAKKQSSDMMVGAYNYYIKQKKILAASNIANDVESILGMLPI